VAALVSSTGFPRWIRKDRDACLQGIQTAALWHSISHPSLSPQPNTSLDDWWELPEPGANDDERNEPCPGLVVASAQIVSTR
jgi:hypothetical protein